VQVIAGLNIVGTTGLTFVFSIIFILLEYLIVNSYLSRLFCKYVPLEYGIIN
jgi:putative Mn2+ efflux pump MntP